jgi:A/G-specific adenine glycosylase
MSVSVPLFHQLLFSWWRKSGRILPWREKDGVSNQDSTEKNSAQQEPFQIREKTFGQYFASDSVRDPYRVIVAEMMLQQTQVDRVLPKYQSWMEKWPKLSDLAQANLSEVLIFWQGLGYNRRARFLWLLAKEITEKLRGQWPTTEEELMKLPGIGKYTSRAVLSFGFGQHVGVVDTNVKRVFGRVLDGEQTKTEREYFVLADQILPSGQADPWNQALMDFGALICTAKAPKCEICPLATICTANLSAQQNGFATFAEYVTFKNKQEKNKPSPSDLGVTKKIRFEDTNRYFRGRIMDELRLQFLEKEKLWTLVQEKYGLADAERFENILINLEKEGLIRITSSTISLG